MVREVNLAEELGKGDKNKHWKYELLLKRRQQSGNGHEMEKSFQEIQQ